MPTVSLISEVTNNNTEVRNASLGSPIYVSLSREYATTLLERVSAILSHEGTQDIADEFQAILDNNLEASVEMRATVSIKNSKGIYRMKQTTPWPDFDIVIIFDNSGIGEYETVYDDKQLTLSIGRR